MGRKAQKNDSLPGSLDMLILRTLSRRDLHGYGIVQFIQQSSDNELLVEEGSLYPALQRLELNGWIDGVWGVTSNNRRARIYKITASGRRQLAAETRKYAKLTLAIARVMGLTAPALYNYFASHDELVRHVLAGIFAELTDEVRRAAAAAAAAGDPAAPLAAACHQFRRWAIGPEVFAQPAPQPERAAVPAE